MSTIDNTDEHLEHIEPNVIVIEHNLSVENLPNLHVESLATNIFDKNLTSTTPLTTPIVALHEGSKEVIIREDTSNDTQRELQNPLHDTNASGYTEAPEISSRKRNASLNAFGYASHYKADLNRDASRPYSGTPHNSHRHRNRNRSSNRSVSITALGHSHYVYEREGNQSTTSNTDSDEDSLHQDSGSRDSRRNAHRGPSSSGNRPTMSGYGPSTSGYRPNTSRYGPSTSGSVSRNRDWGVRRVRRVHQNSSRFMIPRAPFSRAVKQILEYSNRNHITRMTKSAMETCQEDCENFFIEHFGDCYLATLHAKRVTLMISDMVLIRRVKGRTFLIN